MAERVSTPNVGQMFRSATEKVGSKESVSSGKVWSSFQSFFNLDTTKPDTSVSAGKIQKWPNGTSRISLVVRCTNQGDDLKHQTDLSFRHMSTSARYQNARTRQLFSLAKWLLDQITRSAPAPLSDLPR